jgi:hypothetical protein
MLPCRRPNITAEPEARCGSFLAKEVPVMAIDNARMRIKNEDLFVIMIRPFVEGYKPLL